MLMGIGAQPPRTVLTHPAHNGSGIFVPLYKKGGVARRAGGIYLHSLPYVPRRRGSGSSDCRLKNSRHLCWRARLAALAACAWQADQDSKLAMHRSKTPHNVQAHARHRQRRPARTHLQPSPQAPSRRGTGNDNSRPIGPSRIGTGSNDVDRSLDNRLARMRNYKPVLLEGGHRRGIVSTVDTSRGRGPSGIAGHTGTGRPQHRLRAGARLSICSARC